MSLLRDWLIPWFQNDYSSPMFNITKYQYPGPKGHFIINKENDSYIYLLFFGPNCVIYPLLLEEAE